MLLVVGAGGWRLEGSIFRIEEGMLHEQRVSGEHCSARV